MKPLRLDLYILLFYLRDKSKNLFMWKEVKAVSKDVIIPKSFTCSSQQNAG